MPQVNRQTPAGPAATTRSRDRRTRVFGRIKPIGFDQEEGIKMLLYGRGGTGKTTLWATFPHPILAIVCSGSKKPGELRSIDTSEYWEKIRTVTLETAAEMGELASGLVGEEQTGDPEFRTVVLDHITGFQDLVLRDVLGVAELPEQKGWGLATQQQ